MAKIHIYTSSGKLERTFKNVEINKIRTMFLGIPKRQVLMFNYKTSYGGIEYRSIDLIDGRTFTIFKDKE